MSPRTSGRRGFTIVELIVVMVLGTLLVLGALQVLVTNRRAYTIQNADLQSQQQLRASMEVLLAELRQLSTRGGDLLTANASEIQVRSMDDLGVVCEIIPPVLRVEPLTEAFDSGDPLFVFLDGDPMTSADDVWKLWTPTLVTAIGATCSGGAAGAAQELTFSGAAANAITTDSVLVGAPVRDFDVHTWSTITTGGYWYLALAEGGNPAVEVVGPLAPASRSNPLQFRYLDENGNAVGAGSLTDVRQVEVKVYSWSPVVGRDGVNVQDSLILRVNTRN